MCKKISEFLNKLYGITMSVSFFAGFLPVPVFVLALLVGGQLGETISVFLYQKYYPCVIVLGAISVVIGLVAMYLGKQEGLSVKKVS